MENLIPAMYLHVNNITPLCVEFSNQSICHLFPSLQEEQKWTVQRRKKSRNCVGPSCWVTWWTKSSSLSTAQLILSRNETMCSENGCAFAACFHIWYLPVPLTSALMAAGSCVKRKENVSSWLISISEQNPWILWQRHRRSMCLCFSFASNVK